MRPNKCRSSGCIWLLKQPSDTSQTAASPLPNGLPKGMGAAEKRGVAVLRGVPLPYADTSSSPECMGPALAVMLRPLAGGEACSAAHHAASSFGEQPSF